MSQQTNGLYEFGSFRLDRQERLLLRDGVVVSLTPKAFDLLLALIERHGRLVEKEELFKAVWPDTIVEESNLSSNIALIRKVLADGENGLKFIETVPKRGYRFVATVREPVAVSVAVPRPEPAYSTDNAMTLAGTPGPSTGRWQPIVRRRAAIAALAGVVIVAVGAWFYFRRPPVLTEKDTILLADFENKTGEENFDRMLKQGLAIQLQQSPFLNLFPEAQMRDELKRMKRPPNEHVTAEIGREICERQNLKALITGSIAPLGIHYVITLEVLNAQSGASLARQQVEVNSREQVMRALTQAATRLREQLGESLSSIQRFDKALEEATTSNPEAFRAWSLGLEQSSRGELMEAIPFYKRAVQLDPDFAQAWGSLSVVYRFTGQTESAAEAAERGYALRERVSEYEQLRIANFYHGFVTGDLNKRIEVLTMLRQMYHREGGLDLAVTHNMLGQYDQAAVEARGAIRLLPNFPPAHRSLVWALVRLNRFAEARDHLAQSFQPKLYNTLIHSYLYEIAFVSNDAAEMQRELDWTRGKLDEYVGLDWQAGGAAYAGRWRLARDFSRRSIELSAQGSTKEVAAQYATEQALREAVFGDCRAAKTDVKQGVMFAGGRTSLLRAALALALCGETNQAKPLVDELTKLYPEDTLINSIWLPAIRAATDLQHGDATQAIEQLQAALRYEAAAEFWPQYLRGQAYLKLGRGTEAAAEFQKILDHRGYAPLSPLSPLAAMGLARTAQLQGDMAKARKSYQGFFALWKDADSNLPPLIAARQEYERLK